MDSATLHGNMESEDYDELPGINWSVLKHSLEHPAKSMWELQKKNQPTDRMILGSAIHCLFLEGEDAYARQYAVCPKVDRRTKDGKAAYSAFVERSRGKSVLSEESDLNVRKVVKSLAKHPAASDYVVTHQAEQAIRFELIDGLWGKGIIDLMPTGDGPIVDLKTTRDASPAGFARQIANMHYHGQACYYRRAVASHDGKPRRDFVFIAVEVEPPYMIGVYKLNQESIECGERMVDVAIDRWYAASRGQQGFDPHYTDYVEDLSIPVWAMGKDVENVLA